MSEVSRRGVVSDEAAEIVRRKFSSRLKAALGLTASTKAWRGEEIDHDDVVTSQWPASTKELGEVEDEDDDEEERLPRQEGSASWRSKASASTAASEVEEAFRDEAVGRPSSELLRRRRRP